MRQFATRLLAWVMASGALVMQTSAAAPAYAGRENPNPVMGGPSVDVLLVTLMLVAAGLALAAFAAFILWWERQDTEGAEHNEQQQRRL